MLEIGTGSGYQTAVLAEIAERVFSIERIAPLYRRALALLDHLGYHNVVLRHGDGTLGWRDHAPYDAIVVTAGAPHVPRELRDQLAPGGRLVIPVGERHLQTLMRITRGEGATAARRSAAASSSASSAATAGQGAEKGPSAAVALRPSSLRRTARTPHSSGLARLAPGPF